MMEDDVNCRYSTTQKKDLLLWGAKGLEKSIG